MKIDCIIGMSLDGRIDWIKDPATLQEIYYGMVMTRPYDSMIAGSATMLAAHYDSDNTQKYSGQTLVAIDGKGKIRNWEIIKKQAWWNDKPVVLCTPATPVEYLEYVRDCGVEAVISGAENVDLEESVKVLEEKFKLQYMRIDSGGVLLGKFLRKKLVDNVTVIIMPQLTGGNTPRTIFYEEDLKSIDGIVSLGLVDTKTVKDDYVALTYKVLKDT